MLADIYSFCRPYSPSNPWCLLNSNSEGLSSCRSSGGTKTGLSEEAQSGSQSRQEIIEGNIGFFRRIDLLYDSIDLPIGILGCELRCEVPIVEEGVNRYNVGQYMQKAIGGLSSPPRMRPLTEYCLHDITNLRFYIRA